VEGTFVWPGICRGQPKVALIVLPTPRRRLPHFALVYREVPLISKVRRRPATRLQPVEVKLSMRDSMDSENC